MGKSNKTTSKTVAEPWKGAQPFLHDLVADARQAYAGGLFDVAPYPGIRVAPQSGLTQLGQQQIYDIASQGNPFLQPAQGAFSNIVGGGNVYRDFDTLKQEVLSDVIPAVSSRFANAGMLDSTVAADTISRAAAGAIAPIEYGAYENAQNRRLQALGMTPDLARSIYVDPLMAMTAGQGLDAFNQSVLDSAMQAWYEQANRPFQELQRAASLALGFGGTGGTQTTKQPQSTGLQVLGGLMQAASLPLAAWLMSDRRVKVDIEPAGQTAEGWPQYTFRYVWDAEGTRRVGVMADEVPPEIVREIGGLKLVDYSRVTLTPVRG